MYGKKSSSVFALFFILFLCTADPAQSDEKEQVHKLDEIVVKSQSMIDKKKDITMDTVGLAASVDVITSEDIERLSVFDVTDVFRKVPGVSVFNYDQGDIGFGFQIGKSNPLLFWRGITATVIGITAIIRGDRHSENLQHPFGTVLFPAEFNMSTANGEWRTICL